MINCFLIAPLVSDKAVDSVIANLVRAGYQVSQVNGDIPIVSANGAEFIMLAQLSSTNHSDTKEVAKHITSTMSAIKHHGYTIAPSFYMVRSNLTSAGIKKPISKQVSYLKVVKEKGPFAKEDEDKS